MVAVYVQLAALWKSDLLAESTFTISLFSNHGYVERSKFGKSMEKVFA